MESIPEIITRDGKKYAVGGGREIRLRDKPVFFSHAITFPLDVKPIHIESCLKKTNLSRKTICLAGEIFRPDKTDSNTWQLSSETTRLVGKVHILEELNATTALVDGLALPFAIDFSDWLLDELNGPNTKDDDQAQATAPDLSNIKDDSFMPYPIGLTLKVPLSDVVNNVNFYNNDKELGLTFKSHKSDIAAIWSIGNCLIEARRVTDEVTEISLDKYKKMAPDFDTDNSWKKIISSFEKAGLVSRYETLNDSETTQEILNTILPPFEPPQMSKSEFKAKTRIKYPEISGDELSQLYRQIEESRNELRERERLSNKTADEAAQEFMDKIGVDAAPDLSNMKGDFFMFIGKLENIVNTIDEFSFTSQMYDVVRKKGEGVIVYRFYMVDNPWDDKGKLYAGDIIVNLQRRQIKFSIRLSDDYFRGFTPNAQESVKFFLDARIKQNQPIREQPAQATAPNDDQAQATTPAGGDEQAQTAQATAPTLSKMYQKIITLLGDINNDKLGFSGVTVGIDEKLKPKGFVCQIEWHEEILGHIVFTEGERPEFIDNTVKHSGTIYKNGATEHTQKMQPGHRVFSRIQALIEKIIDEATAPNDDQAQATAPAGGGDKLAQTAQVRQATKKLKPAQEKKLALYQEMIKIAQSELINREDAWARIASREGLTHPYDTARRWGRYAD